MLGRIITGVRLVQHLGPGWAWSRLTNAASTRLGWLERQSPRTAWKSWTVDSADKVLRIWRQQRGQFFFDSSSILGRGEHFRGFDEVGGGPLAEAEDLQEGVFRYFSIHRRSLGTPPDWFLNTWTGQRLDSTSHWSRIGDFGAGDIKIVWEPSRFAFVFALVRSYGRTGDNRHAELFWQLVESWRAANPPNTGVNWRCGQESTFRAMAWLFGLWAFEKAPATTAVRVAGLLEMLEATGKRIRCHLDYALSQRNNHGVSEAVGLFTLGTLLPWLPDASTWATRGRELLERLALQLVYEDGAFSQHSFNYQRVLLNDYSWALRLAQLAGSPLSSATHDRIRKSAILLAEWISPADGTVPNHGPNDGARILPLDNTPYTDHRSAAQLGSLASGGPRLFGSGPWDETESWLLGTSCATANLQPVPDGIRSAPIGGYYGWVSANAAVFLHVPQFRDRPAHADLLQCDIVLDGIRLSRDPGTFSYNSRPPWEHGLASTRFHSTVEVDGLDQMERVSRFIWLPWPKCAVTGSGLSPDGALHWLEAEHSGYGRLPNPVIHRRRVIGFKDEFVVVLDRISAPEEHRARLHWLLPDLACTASADSGQLRLSQGTHAFEVKWGTSDSTGQSSLVRAGESTARGWESLHYLLAIPAWSLECTAAGKVIDFWTVFSRGSVLVDHSSAGISVASATGGRIRSGWAGEQSSPLSISDEPLRSSL